MYLCFPSGNVASFAELASLPYVTLTEAAGRQKLLQSSDGQAALKAFCRTIGPC
jgi:hypothetical protein